MRSALSTCFALLLVVAFVTQPVLAGGDAEVAPDQVEPIASTLSEAQIAAARSQVAEQLVDLGRPADDAATSVTLLTSADLAVLSANPEMVQTASMSPEMEILLGSLLIVGVIVAIVAAGGSVHISL